MLLLCADGRLFFAKAKGGSSFAAHARRFLYDVGRK
jgi:hypothetical protein